MSKKVDPDDAPEGYKAVLAPEIGSCSGCATTFCSEICDGANCAGVDRADGCDTVLKLEGARKMTKGEKEMMLNPDRRIFDDLPVGVRKLMREHIGELQALSSGGNWCAAVRSDALCAGTVYRIDPATETEQEYTVAPVYQSGRAYGADGYTLGYTTSMVDFAGIRYAGSDEWLGVVDTVKYGVPVQVRFIKGD